MIPINPAPVTRPMTYKGDPISLEWMAWFNMVSKSANVVAISVTGSRGGNAALASLLTALATQGLIVNNTTA